MWDQLLDDEVTSLDRDALARSDEEDADSTLWDGEVRGVQLEPCSVGRSCEILDELVDSPTERRPEHAERFRRRRDHMEAAFAEAMTQHPPRFLAAVPDEVVSVTAM